MCEHISGSEKNDENRKQKCLKYKHQPDILHGSIMNTMNESEVQP